MKILLLGGGGREHAMGWKLAQSPKLTELICAPGNPGMAHLGRLEPGLDPADTDTVATYAADEAVDLVVIGPEAPLAAGVVDALGAAGVAAFGPSRAAAQLETSKTFAKEVMDEAGVPTAAYGSFSKAQEALAYLAQVRPPYVVKADGLAAGKGVLVTSDIDEAQAWVERCFAGGFGEAGQRVVIERFLEGPELSLFGLTDGHSIIPLRAARDYKRLLDGGRGPNTGGMGCYTPVVGHSDLWVRERLETLVRPVLRELNRRGTPYVGFIYAGLVLTAGGPQVLEFNCRLGDPEAQVILPSLTTDLIDLMLSCIEHRAHEAAANWSRSAAVDVVLAAKGYPEAPVTGDEIVGLGEDAVGSVVFQAGTTTDAAGHLLTNGGRVLNVVGLGPDLSSARERAYARASQIQFAGKQFRSDIGR